MNRELHIKLLKRCIEISKNAREHGNTPFGALLADPKGNILLEQENIEITERICTGHAETSLAAKASKVYDKISFGTAHYTLQQSLVPCVQELSIGEI